MPPAAAQGTGQCWDRIIYIQALPSLLAFLKINLYDLHSSVFETWMKLLCQFGHFILLVQLRAPCQTIVELQINHNTQGHIVIERDETADVPRSSSWGLWEIVANQDKMCSYPKAAAAKQELNVADHNTTSCDHKVLGDTLASCLATNTVQVLLGFVMYCHISLRSPRFTNFYKVGHLCSGCHGRFFECLKIFPSVHISHGKILLSIPFPYVVSWSPRFINIVDTVPLRCLMIIPFRPWWPETWLPWSPGT